MQKEKDKIKNSDLPRGYISFSAWKLWSSSQEKYYAKYVLGETERQTEALLRGKKFAESQETLRGKFGEVPIECLTQKGLKLYGKLDFYDGKTIVDDKTSKNFANIHKRSEEQILFYQLIIYRRDGFIPRGELHHYQTNDDMAILLGEKEINNKPTIYLCKQPTVKKLLSLEKKIERDTKDIIKYIKWKQKQQTKK